MVLVFSLNVTLSLQLHILVSGSSVCFFQGGFQDTSDCLDDRMFLLI